MRRVCGTLGMFQNYVPKSCSHMIKDPRTGTLSLPQVCKARVNCVSRVSLRDACFWGSIDGERLTDWSVPRWVPSRCLRTPGDTDKNGTRVKELNTWLYFPVKGKGNSVRYFEHDIKVSQMA